MISSKVVRSFALVLGATFALACADSFTGPAPSASPEASALALGSKGLSPAGVSGGDDDSKAKGHNKGDKDAKGIPVTPVGWGRKHTKKARSVSGTIGYKGGTLTIPGSDFTITFPEGALSAPTNIKIISDAGSYVSYEMLPHMKFAKPVLVTQQLKKTKVHGKKVTGTLFGAYFRDNPVGPGGIVNGVLNADEIVPSVTILRRDGTPEMQTWLLSHFSRYMLASN